MFFFCWQRGKISDLTVRVVVSCRTANLVPSIQESADSKDGVQTSLA